MPLFRLPDGRIGLYAHVPKCAGSAVERHLKLRFGRLALLDHAHAKREEPWSRSSPQHAPAEVLDRLFPEDWIAARFATVRHPATRIASAFAFHRDWTGRIGPKARFEAWLDRIDPARPYAFDGHVRPMADLVPEGAAVFRIEEGLEPVVAWIDALAGETRGPRRIESRNTRSDYLARPGAAAKGSRPELTPAALSRIAELYAADFARFGYDPDRPMGAAG